MAARFERGSGELDSVVVDDAGALGRIYLLGANVTAWKPKHGADVLWLSEKSHFVPGKAIRGGVPICLPWFGAHPTDAKAPQHGFARTHVWELVSTSEAVVLRFAGPEFEARYTVAMGASLDLSLEVKNTSRAPFTFTEALHTYLTVTDVREVKVTGLEGAPFTDKLDGKEKVEEGSIRIRAETDRLYYDSQATCVLHDPVLARRISVKKTGSNTTVVWNPWVDKAKAMSDFGDDEWKGMICIETVNAGPNAVTLDAGTSHEMRARIEVESESP
jgi:glucose-6-phosphate 1-epimerase